MGVGTLHLPLHSLLLWDLLRVPKPLARASPACSHLDSFQSHHGLSPLMADAAAQEQSIHVHHSRLATAFVSVLGSPWAQLLQASAGLGWCQSLTGRSTESCWSNALSIALQS